MAKVKKDQPTSVGGVAVEVAMVKNTIDIQAEAKAWQLAEVEIAKLQKQADERKAKLLAYAMENPTAFENNQLRFDCGVLISKTTKEKSTHKPLTADQISWFYASGYQSCVKVELDKKELDKINIQKDKKYLSVIFKSIDYQVQINESYRTTK